MALKRVQIYGLTTSLLAAVTGLARELIVDTTKNTVTVHDGSTQGGHPLAKEDLSNVSLWQAASNSNLGYATAAHITELESLRSDLTTAEAAIAGYGTAAALNTGDILKYALEAGTVAIFYQAAAPSGWTRITSGVDDTVVGLVHAGSPGSTGGSWELSGLTIGGSIPATESAAATVESGGAAAVAATNHTHPISSLTVDSDSTWRPATAYCLLASLDGP